MNCNQIQNAFLDYFDNRLNDIKRSLFEEHLSNCPECKEEFDALMNYHSAIKKINNVSATEDLKEKIIVRLISPKKSYPKKSNVFKLFVRYSGLAAAFVLLFYIIIPNRFFEPVSFETTYIPKIEKTGKRHKKSNSISAIKAKLVNWKIEQLKILINNFDGSLVKKTVDPQTGVPNIIEVRILKKDYTEFVKQLIKLFPDISVPENIPFTFSSYCSITIMINTE